MEPQNNESPSIIAPLKKVTQLSKYLALGLFVILPFLGGYVGYKLAPEKTVEVVKILDKTNTLESGPENWALPNESLQTELINETINEDGLLGCDSRIYSKGESAPFTDFLGLQLPTFEGHIWQETSSGAGSKIWQECRGSKGNQYVVDISVRNYLIPDGCEAIDGGYGKLVCSNSVINIVNNGDQGFSDLLLKQYQENDQYVFDTQLNAVVLSYLFESNDEYKVVMLGPELSFTVSFLKEKHDKDFVAGYIRSVQLPNN